MSIKNEHLLYDYKTIKTPSNNAKSFLKHCHNSYEIIFFKSGHASYVIDEKKYKLHKNDLIFIRPFKYHYIEFFDDSEYSRVNIAFSETIINKSLLSTIPRELEVINCPPGSILESIFNRMNYYTSILLENDFLELLTAMLVEVIYNLNHIDADMISASPTLPAILVSALEYIHKNLFTIKEIREVSNHLNISEQYFFRLFRTQLHISPFKYLTLKRLLHAQSMIRSGKNPTETCFLCGFDNYNSFYRQYTKLFGHSPSQEKNKH